MRKIVVTATVILLAVVWTMLPAAEMVLVKDGVSTAPIVVAEKAPPSTARAAEELADYIERISGARPSILKGAPDPIPEHAIWVGGHVVLANLFPDLDFAFEHPEEILYACDGRHLVVTGRDRVANDEQFEHGTANAVYTFLQRELGVRWLWPGELGTDVPHAKDLTLSPVTYRFHPPIRERKMWRGMYGGRMEKDARAWVRFNRLTLGSLKCHGGHAFTEWWERYHETHPEYFALLSSGTRQPPRNPRDVKLCVSSPGVGEQWLMNAEKTFRENPGRKMVSASPNDGGGFCVCERCRALDHPDGPEIWGYVALTDRYVKFWNALARGLRQRLPGGGVSVGAYAYSAYRTPPVDEELEPNIAVGYVGHFPLANDEVTRREKESWKAWAKRAKLMWFRPNLFHYSGGNLSLPDIAMRRTFRDFRFLADNNCVGLQVDSLPLNWATQGVQFYVMAQMAYNPLQDGEALLKDYYERGLGRAATPVAEYFDLMEKTHESILDRIRHSSGWAREAVAVYQAAYTYDVLKAAEGLLDRAARSVDGVEQKYRDRVAFVRSGFDFVRLQVRIMHAMQRVRESQGRDAGAVRQAVDLCNQRKEMYKKLYPTFAIREARWYHKSRRMGDYMGPPSEELLKAAKEEEVRLGRAEWKLTWSDDFARKQLGDDWRVLEGAWSVENGSLVSKGGGRLVTAREFPGLHKVEFKVSITTGAGKVVSDMDPIIQSDPKGSGYLMQFGGYYNTKSSIQRMGEVVVATEEHKIVPGKVYSVVAEFDGSHLRLIVDGKTLLEHPEQRPLIGENHERVGFYSYMGNVRIESVKVYTAEAIRLTEDGKEQRPEARE